MAGRTATGEFKTARAKIYPVGLNQTLADAIFEAVSRDFSGVLTASQLPLDFSSFAQDEFAPRDVVQPDYHG